MQMTQNMWYTYSVNISKHKKIQHKKQFTYQNALNNKNKRT